MTPVFVIAGAAVIVALLVVLNWWLRRRAFRASVLYETVHGIAVIAGDPLSAAPREEVERETNRVLGLWASACPDWPTRRYLRGLKLQFRTLPFSTPGGLCVAGLYHYLEHRAEVGYAGDLRRSAFAHELGECFYLWHEPVIARPYHEFAAEKGLP